MWLPSYQTASRLAVALGVVLSWTPPLDRAPGATPALSAAEIDDLIAFLKTLTDADVDPERVVRTAASARR